MTMQCPRCGARWDCYIEREVMLNKEATSHNDLFDAFRMSFMF